MRQLVILGMFFFLMGCATSRMPPSLSDQQAAEINGKKYDCVVGVVKHSRPVYSEKLKASLEKTGLFQNVVWAESGHPYEALAEVEEQVHGTAVIPVLTLLTLGIIPTIVSEHHGEVFSLKRPGHQSGKVIISSKYTGKTVLGWVAIPMWLLPGFSCGDPEQTSRYSEYLRHCIISKADSLLVNIEP